MKALIDPRENRVCQLSDDEFPVSPPLMWVDAPPEIMPDSHTYVDGQFIAPEPAPEVVPQRDPAEVLRIALEAKGLLTSADIENAAIVGKVNLK